MTFNSLGAPKLSGFVCSYLPAALGSKSITHHLCFFHSQILCPSYICHIVEKRMKINKKRPGLVHIKKTSDRTSVAWPNVSQSVMFEQMSLWFRHLSIYHTVEMSQQVGRYIVEMYKVGTLSRCHSRQVPTLSICRSRQVHCRDIIVGRYIVEMLQQVGTLSRGTPVHVVTFVEASRCRLSS